MVYDGGYNNNQTCSGRYTTHIIDIASYLLSYLQPDDSVLEVGCGGGALLCHLFHAGLSNISGFDPAYAGNRSFIKKKHWKKEANCYDAIILRHVLEGIDNFKNFLIDIADSVTNSGIIYLELTNARVLEEKSLTFNLFHEYRQYFDEYSIAFALRQCGFYIHETRHYMNGVILGLIAKRVHKNLPCTPKILKKLQKYKNIHIWGIAGKSIHFLTHYSLGVNIVRYGVDIDQQKWEKFIPITGQKIISPSECVELKPDCIILLNENYFDEVKETVSFPVDILTNKELYYE